MQHIEGPIYLHDLTLILKWISNHMSSNVRVEIVYPFPNFTDYNKSKCIYECIFIYIGMDEIGINIIIVFYTNVLKGDRTQYSRVAYDPKLLSNTLS